MSQPCEGYATRLTRRLRESFEGEASDLTIICGEREWKVHKLVLCLNSDVFKKMLQGEFKVRKSSPRMREDQATAYLDAGPCFLELLSDSISDI